MLYMSLARTAIFSSSFVSPDSSRLEPPPRAHATTVAIPCCPPHRVPSTCHPCRLRSVRPCSTHAVCACAARRSVRAPPVCRRHQEPPRRRHCYSAPPPCSEPPLPHHAPPTQQRLTPQPQPLSARRVFDILPEPLFALLSRRVRVPALLHHDLATAS